jgi:AhpD family alkylhydroperoxidase
MPPVPLDESALAALDPPARPRARIDAVMQHRPEAYAGWGAFTGALSSTGTLSPRLVELVRIRIAFHNQCRSCMALRYSVAYEDGLTEGAVCSLERPAEAEDLTPAEKSAIRFADLFATDHLAIDDAVLDDLRLHFTEGEIVELGLQCVRCVGFGRLAAILRVEEDLPQRFLEPVSGRHAPWGGEVLVVSGSTSTTER